MPGRLKLHMHRSLPEGASLRACVFSKDERSWTLSLQVDVGDVHTVRRETGNLVGIDWGVESLITAEP